MTRPYDGALSPREILQLHLIDSNSPTISITIFIVIKLISFIFTIDTRETAIELVPQELQNHPEKPIKRISRESGISKATLR